MEDENDGSLKKTMAIAVGVAISSLGGLALGGAIGAAYTKPKTAYSVLDLNNDGIADFVFENGNNKVPPFGVRDENKLIYVPASEMEKRQKDSVIKVDYDRIEELLNKQ